MARMFRRGTTPGRQRGGVWEFSVCVCGCGCALPPLSWEMEAQPAVCNYQSIKKDQALLLSSLLSLSLSLLCLLSLSLALALSLSRSLSLALSLMPSLSLACSRFLYLSQSLFLSPALNLYISLPLLPSLSMLSLSLSLPPSCVRRLRVHGKDIYTERPRASHHRALLFASISFSFFLSLVYKNKPVIPSALSCRPRVKDVDLAHDLLLYITALQSLHHYTT